jgi:hypothetical protein
VRGAFVVGGVRITEHVDEDVPDRQQKLWDAVLENERKRVQGTGDGRGVTLRTFGLAPRVLALLAGLEIPEGMARYQLTALANKGGHFVTLSTVVQEGKEEAAMAAVRTVVDAYRHLDAAAITGLHQKGWFYTRNGAVVTEPSREVAAESFEVTAHHGAMTFDIESTTVAEPEEARGVFRRRD